MHRLVTGAQTVEVDVEGQQLPLRRQSTSALLGHAGARYAIIPDGRGDPGHRRVVVEPGQLLRHRHPDHPSRAPLQPE